MVYVLGGENMNGTLAPFPWFGGKSRCADLVWQRFGDVRNFIEPFFGSGAVLLSRPETHTGYIETANDKDGYVANFWRAVQADPETVAQHADWPVNEVDLHARHVWLLAQREDLLAHLCGDPEFYDAKIAGWWCWGISSWIGGGWCSGCGSWWPDGAGRLVKKAAGKGVHRQLPHLGNAGQGVHRKSDINSWFDALATRLRRVRVCCGDWKRVCGVGSTIHNGLTGVFLDPPYSAKAERDPRCYAVDSLAVANDVREWAVINGDNPKLRIALCGYEGEHEMPGDWECVAWKANRGYGGHDNPNAWRERIWFSPHCMNPEEELF